MHMNYPQYRDASFLLYLCSIWNCHLGSILQSLSSVEYHHRERMGRRLVGWKMLNLSSGGRVSPPKVCLLLFLLISFLFQDAYPCSQKLSLWFVKQIALIHITFYIYVGDYDDITICLTQYKLIRPPSSCDVYIIQPNLLHNKFKPILNNALVNISAIWIHIEISGVAITPHSILSQTR